MKRTLIAIALSACLTTLAAAKQLYNITLADSQRYTDCSILIKTDTETKFSGSDKDGYVITRTVNNGDILVMAPVAEEKPAPQPKAEDKPKEQQPAEQTKEQATPEQPAQQAQEQPQEDEEQPEEEAKPASRDFQSIADSLHAQLDEVDKALATITGPKFSLERRAKSLRGMIERKLPEVEKAAKQVQDAQDAASAKDAEPFTFEIVKPEDRTKYETDGKAAYDAMVEDMKTGKNSRRVGGLSKFEELRKNFQGIPEYKQAHDWYISTLKDLQKKWGKMLSTEDNRRRKLVGERLEKAHQADAKDIEKVTKMLEDENEKYETAWITPSPHNATMLQDAVSRVEDALRRNKNEQMPDAVGRVPEMLKKYWEEMDQAKALLDAGDCAKALDTLTKSDVFKELTRLNRDLLPEEYRKPLQEQHRALEKAIRERTRSVQNAKRTLGGATTRLERTVEGLENQIHALMNDVKRTVQNQAEDQAEKAKKEAEAKQAAQDEADEADEESGEEESGDEEDGGDDEDPAKGDEEGKE